MPGFRYTHRDGRTGETTSKNHWEAIYDALGESDYCEFPGDVILRWSEVTDPGDVVRRTSVRVRENSGKHAAGETLGTLEQLK